MSESASPNSPTDLSRFLLEILVECPRCQAAALVSGAGLRSGKAPSLACQDCGYSRSGWPEENAQLRVGAPVDPYYGYPLWLQRELGGHTLWAYNREHLQFLHDYVSASIRPSTFGRNGALGSRLPQWMIEAAHRDRVLKVIDQLRGRR